MPLLQVNYFEIGTELQSLVEPGTVLLVPLHQDGVGRPNPLGNVTAASDPQPFPVGRVAHDPARHDFSAQMGATQVKEPFVLDSGDDLVAQGVVGQVGAQDPFQVVGLPGTQDLKRRSASEVGRTLIVEVLFLGLTYGKLSNSTNWAGGQNQSMSKNTLSNQLLDSQSIPKWH